MLGYVLAVCFCWPLHLMDSLGFAADVRKADGRGASPAASPDKAPDDGGGGGADGAADEAATPEAAPQPAPVPKLVLPAGPAAFGPAIGGLTRSSRRAGGWNSPSPLPSPAPFFPGQNRYI